MVDTVFSSDSLSLANTQNVSMNSVRIPVQYLATIADIANADGMLSDMVEY